MTMGILDRILDGSTEKHIMDMGKEVIDQAVAANKILTKIINGSQDIDELREIERVADKKVFEITYSITAGAIAPNLIDDMIRFVDMEDDIVDTIYNLARAIIRYRRGRENNPYIKKNLLELSQLINSALVLLYEMHKSDSIITARTLRHKIYELENRGDEIKHAMLDHAFEADVDFRLFYHMQNVAYLADDVLDGCQDASDMIVSILRSIIT